jgi:thiol-disulfide isomerase/thioredoxin
MSPDRAPHRELFMKEKILKIGRRDFVKIGVMAGIATILPEIISCRTKAVPGVGSRFSAIVLSDVMGNKIAIPTDSTGKIALIHFWASWCRTCRGEMAHLESIANKYRQKDVVTYSIGIGEKKSTAVAYISNLNISYPVLLDPDSTTKKQFGIVGIPTYYVLDREGIIRSKIFGEVDDLKWEKIIGALI